MLKKTIISLLISISLFTVIRLIASISLIIESNKVKGSLIISVLLVVLSIVLYTLNRKYNLKKLNIIPKSYYKRNLLTIVDKLMIVISAFILDVLLENSVKNIFKMDKSNNQIKIEDIYENQNILENVIGHAIEPAFYEEFVYRGLTYIIVLTIVSFCLRNMKNNQKTIMLLASISFIVISSIMFGYIHVRYDVLMGEFSQMWPYLTTGFIYSVVYISTKNISYVIGMHFFNNLIGIFSIKENMKMIENMYTLMFSTLFILIMIKLYKIVHK